MTNYKIETLPLEAMKEYEKHIRFRPAEQERAQAKPDTKAYIHADSFTLGVVLCYLVMVAMMAFVHWLNWWAVPTLVLAGLIGWVWRRMGKGDR